MDVSQCSHEEAVQRFLEASEPIMVEVKRRQGKVSQTTEAKVCKDLCKTFKSNVKGKVETDEA